MNPLRNASLRTRVTALSLLVLAAVLATVAVLTEVVFVAVSRADLHSELASRASLAQQLATQGVADDDVARQVDGPGIRAILVGTGPGTQRYRARPDDVTVTQNLPDGSRLLLVAQASPDSAAQVRLRRTLLLLSIGALAVAGGVTLVTTRVALQPLERMTALARSITRGDRGGRLGPTRTDTELGRTAAAFDDMLDALERSEAAAVASEARTRRFVADAAHELRTPLAGVSALVEATLDPELPAEERERLQLLLLRESRRVGRLVDDLLALARIDAGIELRREPVDLLAVATEAVERARLLTDAPITVTGAPSPVVGDAARLGQVLDNLLGNARKHTPPGTAVAVAVGPGEVRVTDDGPGVPAPERQRIFDRLVRLDESRPTGGAGLGLAIARGIALAHGGDLRCEGATFVLTVPGAAAA